MLMKKIFPAFVFILSGVVSYSKTIDSERALALASRFFELNGTKVGTSSLKVSRRGVAKEVPAPIALSDDPTYYAVNRQGGGFVIIAADDNVAPVIAWSYEGNIPADGELSNNMKWWFDDVVSSQIAYARATGTKKYGSEDVLLISGAPVVEYKTANWDQDNPFNLESPKINNKKTVTGCVATAAAIKCRYHQWPRRGKGTIPAYTYESEEFGKSISVSPNTLGRVYDYDSMPLTRYTGRWTSTQKTAIAALMYDLGTGCKMQYGTYDGNGSGAFSDDLAYALKTYFHYDSKTECVSKGRTSDSEWVTRLKDELDKNGPVIYGGEDTKNGGHQFILDGYTDDDYFHVNWGWSGECNCYVTLSSMIPEGESYNFKKNQDALFNCAPDGGPYTPDYVADMTSVKYEDKSLTISCKEKFDCLIYLEGKMVKSFYNIPEGSSIDIPLSGLNGPGKYNVLVGITDYYKIFPNAQFSFDFKFKNL